MTIDGNLSESEWRNAKELDNFLTVFPNDKSNPKYKTKIKYFSNQDGLYFGIINEQPLSTQVSQKPPKRCIKCRFRSYLFDYRFRCKCKYWLRIYC